MKTRRLLTLLLAPALLLQVSPAAPHAWRLEAGRLWPAPLPAGLTAVEPAASGDLDGDGSPESLSLSGGRARIRSGERTAWESPTGWEVVQAQFGDLDGDGQPEAALLVWRPFQPWPVDRWLPHGGRLDGFHDPDGRSCHLILIHWRRGAYRQLWAGSALADPILRFAAADLDGDGRQELLALSGRYDLPRSAPGTAIEVWEWNGFGFSIVTSLEGNFGHFGLARPEAGPLLILVP